MARLAYAICHCYVWPVLSDRRVIVGRCGRCGAAAQVVAFSPITALEIFRSDRRRDPVPI